VGRSALSRHITWQWTTEECARYFPDAIAPDRRSALEAFLWLIEDGEIEGISDDEFNKIREPFSSSTPPRSRLRPPVNIFIQTAFSFDHVHPTEGTSAGRMSPSAPRCDEHAALIGNRPQRDICGTQSSLRLCLSAGWNRLTLRGRKAISREGKSVQIN
jgi:hypothetical protein